MERCITAAEMETAFWRGRLASEKRWKCEEDVLLCSRLREGGFRRSRVVGRALVMRRENMLKTDVATGGDTNRASRRNERWWSVDADMFLKKRLKVMCWMKMSVTRSRWVMLVPTYLTYGTWSFVTFSRSTALFKLRIPVPRTKMRDIAVGGDMMESQHQYGISPLSFNVASVSNPCLVLIRIS